MSPCSNFSFAFPSKKRMTPFYLSSAPTIFRKPCSARYTLDARRALEFQILQDTTPPPPPRLHAACFSFRSARSLVCHERLSRRDQLVPFFLRRRKLHPSVSFGNSAREIGVAIILCLAPLSLPLFLCVFEEGTIGGGVSIVDNCS